jgi:hypothetical protein
MSQYSDGSAVPVISDECLCGDPTLPHVFPGRFIADRIHAAFPRAKILIGVREQKAIAASFYREYLLGTGRNPIERFVGTGKEWLGFAPILPQEYLEYDWVVGYYQKLYGAQNVLVLPMERLKKDATGYIQSLLDFCECTGRIEDFSPPRHVGLSAAALSVRRRLNPLINPSPMRPPPATFLERCVHKTGRVIHRFAPSRLNIPLEQHWKTVIERRYKGVFRESNRRLAHLTGIDLGALGYEV